MYHNLEELKEMVAAKLSTEQILDILGWEMSDLVEHLKEDINENAEAFEDAVK
jgi:transcription initiation factor IIE alpha subunit